MQKESYEFLEKLLLSPSPSGFETRIQSVVRKRVSRYADTVEVDVHGNLIAALNPDAKVRVMLAGHCDQIGFMVTHIDEQGFIYFNGIGGLDAGTLPGSPVIIQTRSGPVDGVIGHKAIHLQAAEERGKKHEIKRMWIDIGATDGKSARAQVSVGDPGTFVLGVTKLGKNLIASPGCDDRVGVFVVMEALRLMKAAGVGKKKSPIGIFAVSTVQEEVGLRGARTSCYGIDPLVGIAVDVTHASDHPSVDAKEIGTVKLGQGPTIARGPNINVPLEAMLVSTAKKKKIPFQSLAASGITGTDANVIQVSRAGVAAALISIPNRYMHSQVEVVDLRDLENAAKLIAATVAGITSRTSFIPA